MEIEEILLRKLRGHMAYKKQVEPYKIFRDAELNILLQVRPKTMEDLTKIKGFPEAGARVACCGQSILDIFNRPKDIDDFDVKLDSKGNLSVNTQLIPLSVF